ncbi:MAG: radical SAM protein [Clostridia bacterium]|nr:radical SAM protein [Clostridia bacterium]
MNKYLRNLNRIEFVVTMACTGKCKHCSQGECRSTDKLDKALCADAVKKIANEYNINSVMTFGGEPLLCADTVCEIHKVAKETDIPHRQLITNGYFSKNIDKIKAVAKNLADSGVNDILLSVDAFHQETIPLDIVKSFAKAILETGTQIKVQPAWLVSETDDNPYNLITREILDEFENMGISANEGNVIFPMGNALKYPGDYLKPMAENENPCWEDPADIRAICFSANGDILGNNIYKKDITDILSDYSPK